MLRLDFSASDLNLAENREKTRRASISGVQDKVQLKRVRGGFAVVESGGDYILKPVPRSTYAELAADIPANEAVTMDIAEKVFGVKTAEHELVEMKDGEYAYLTRRFDRRCGERVQQEDFCQLAGRTPETHGDNYKYDASYEELAGLMRKYCPASAVENPKRPSPAILTNSSTASAPLRNEEIRALRAMARNAILSASAKRWQRNGKKGTFDEEPGR